MKRFQIGLVLLLGLLAASLLVQHAMHTRQAPIADALEAAAMEASAGNWAEANAFARQAAVGWERSWSFSAAFADHGPMEDVDCLLKQLPVFAKSRDEAQFTALCRELSRRVRAVADAQTLNWRNLL